MSRRPTFDVKATSSKVDVELVPVFEGTGSKVQPPKGAYQSFGLKLKKASAFAGKRGEVELFHFEGAGTATHLLLVGLGVAADVREEDARIAGAKALRLLQAKKLKTVRVDVEQLKTAKQHYVADLTGAFVEGAGLASYQMTKYKSDKKNESILPKFTLFTKNTTLAKELKEAVEIAVAAVESVEVARDWSNEPGNIGIPKYYSAEAQKWAKKLGLKIKVLGERDLKREKMDMMLSVGRGSKNESQMVILEYTPKSRTSNKTIVLVGKGVTFDTGGISLKPGGGMEEMKHDMSGASTMFGAITLCARWQVPHRVVALLGFAENMPSGEAIVPSSIVTSRSGKMVEIDNTDAEGRLVLGDVLTYAQDKYKPDVLIDAATLTGAVGVALGNQCCAVLSNDDDLAQSLKEYGDEYFERMWQLPLFDEYLDQLKSPLADLKNVGGRLAGTITAGKFLQQFIRKDQKWAHMDIAFTAWNLGHVPYHPAKGATGAHVRTLAGFIADL